MRNRIITGNGGSNKLKMQMAGFPDFDAFKAAAASGDLLCDLSALTAEEAPDGVQETGTPLTAANLITDETAVALGDPSANPTPETAFAALAAMLGGVADYVKDYGVRNNWNYRHWASNRLEIFRTLPSASLTINTASGALFTAAQPSVLNFPVTFSAIHDAEVEVTSATYPVLTCIRAVNANSITYQPFSTIARSQATAYRIQCYVIGIYTGTV